MCSQSNKVGHPVRGDQSHPGEYCYKECEACDKIHARGACKAKKVMETLRSMMKNGGGARIPDGIAENLVEVGSRTRAEICDSFVAFAYMAMGEK